MLKNNHFNNINLVVLVALLFLASTQMSYADRHSHRADYQVHNLVSNIPGKADFIDQDLVNAWGVALNPDGFAWVNDGGTGKSTLYDGEGKK
jgi:hypothetical protein